MAKMTVIPLSGHIGALVEDLSLSALSDSEFDAVKQAFLDHCVLVFPKQLLTIEEHLQFAARWGEFSTSPFVQYHPEHPAVLQLSNLGKANAVTENWHFDSSFLPAPPSLTILSARKIPVGGDTMWSNQYHAYDTLSEGMKALLDGVRGEFAGTRLAKRVGKDSDIPFSFHPIFRTHPDTGRKALFVGHPGDTLRCLEGMTQEESLPIIQYLYKHSTNPDRVYRHHWAEGDIVMWDNRCTMHYAVHDYGDQTRELHRVSICGDIPR
ncbi:MAG: taurine dioxygenase [Gemmatimonadetes bacterium]|nr:taurine dioxygenase [Gemmatimonadota bacterium]